MPGWALIPFNRQPTLLKIKHKNLDTPQKDIVDRETIPNRGQTLSMGHMRGQLFQLRS